MERNLLCAFARDFSRKSGEFLDKASKLGRTFREETLTDVLMGGLVAFRPLGIEVYFPDEPRTGADMEWLFRRKDGASHYRILIQAKKLGGSGKVWTRRSYPEIFHRVRSSNQLQTDILLREARSLPATVPLYMFYTNQSVCDLAAKSGSVLHGTSIVDGQLVNDLVHGRLTGKLTAFEATSLKVLQPKMDPLSKLLCIAGSGAEKEFRTQLEHFLFLFDGQDKVSLNGVIPTPEKIHQQLQDIVKGDLPPIGEGQPDSHYERGRERFRVTFWT